MFIGRSKVSASFSDTDRLSLSDVDISAIERSRFRPVVSVAFSPRPIVYETRVLLGPSPVVHCLCAKSLNIVSYLTRPAGIASDPISFDVQAMMSGIVPDRI